MTPVPENEFVSWLKTKDLTWEPKNGYIDFADKSREDRFWVMPPRGAGIVYFLSVILNALDRWEYFMICKQGCTSWHETDENDHSMIHQVHNHIASSSGVSKDFRGALRFDKSELTTVLTLLFNQLLFGWCMWDDVYVIPNHAQQIVKTSHHDVVHVMFKDPERVGTYVKQMEESKFLLPKKVPDGTFKVPHWMKKDK